MGRDSNFDAVPLYKSPWQILTLIAVLALGIGLRVYGLENESLWYDEAVSISVLDEPTLGEFIEAERAQDPAMVPLYFVIEYYVSQATDRSILAIRYISVIAAIIAMVLIYMFGRSLYGHFGGLLALLFLAMAKKQIWHGQDIRMYSLYYTFALLSAYMLYLAVHRNKKWAWGVCILANGLALSTHFFTVTLLLVEGLYLLYFYGFRKKQVYLWTAAHVPLLIPFFWWVLTFSHHDIGVMIGWIPKPTLTLLFKAYFFVFTGPHMHVNEEMPHLLFPGGAFVGIVFLLLLLRILKVAFGKMSVVQTETLTDSVRRLTIDWNREGWLRFTENRRFSGAIMGFLVLWFLLPPFVLYLLSQVVRPCFVERYVLHSSFALYLLAAGAICSLRTNWTRTIAIVAAVWTCVYVLEDLKRPMRPNWKGVAEHIADGYAQDDLIRVPERYRRDRTLPMQCYQPDLPIVSIGEDFANEVMALASLGNTVWVPVIVQHPLSPKAFQSELAKHNVPFTMDVIPGRYQIAVFHLNAERKYILENINLVTGGISTPLSQVVSAPGSPLDNSAPTPVSP